jgi:hypothetical protein
MDEAAERVVNHAMALQWRLAPEMFADDCAGKMPAAVLCADVPRMLVRFIANLEMFGRKRCFQFFPNQANAIRCHGSTFRKGFTVTSAKTPAAT